MVKRDNGCTFARFKYQYVLFQLFEKSMIRTNILRILHILPQACLRARLFLVGLLLVWLAAVPVASAQEPEQERFTTEGTRFYALFPRITGTKVNDVTLQLRVVVTARENVSVSILRLLGDRIERKTVAAGQTWVSTPISANQGYLYDDDVIGQRGVQIVSDDGKTPFSCFILAQSGPLGNSARDASVLIPYQSFGYEYMIQTFPQDGKSTEFAILATEANTTVRIIPTTQTSTGAAAGEQIIRNLPRNRNIMIASKQKIKASGDTLDLSGSLICADKPIAVFAANEMVNIPMAESYSNDFTLEQLPPINTLGTRFFVSRPNEHIKNMECCVTALYDNTSVEVIRYNEETGKNLTNTYTLAARQSLGVRPVMTEKISNIVIKTSQPALCFNYMTSSSYNSEDIYDANGNLTAQYTWGDPANAMIVPWDHRVKRMTFFARPLETQSDDALQFHYLQVNVPKKDIGLLQLNGVTVSSSLFKTYGGDATMAYATIPVEAGENKGYDLTTTGDGFTGYVCGISQAGTGYMYTLGYRLDLLADSLYITDTENYMSPYSYELARMKNGWYQRQFIDFPPDKHRLDTAIICDKTTLNFAVDCDHTFDSVIWQVDKLTNKGAVERIVVREDFPFAKLHKWKHQFEVDLDKDLEASKRDPYTNYKVQALLCHQRVLCSEDMPIYDTLKTIVRVMRSYDDTIPRVICTGDTTYFFSDKSYAAVPQYSELGNPKERQSTMFIADKSVTGIVEEAPFKYRVGVGKKYYLQRKYATKNGCDSLVTFAVYVCEPKTYQLPDVVLTHSKPSIKFTGGANTFYNGKTINKAGVYTDHLKTVGCNCGGLVDPDFEGCDSIVTLRVHLRDTLTTSFCDRTDNPELYGVDWKDFVWTGHTKVFPNVASEVAVGETKKFEDCYTTKDGLDSCYVLYLTRDPVTVKPYEFIIPNGFAYTWEYGDGEITRTKGIPPGQNETKTFNERIKYENGCPMLFHLTLTWIEMEAKIEERSVCLNDTIMYRGRIYAGADWQDTYPNASFTPLETRGLGRFQIEVETVDLGSSKITYWIGLTVNPTYSVENKRYLCDNEVIEHNGEYFAGSKAVTDLPITKRLTQSETEYDRNIGSELGCDSIVHTIFYMSETYRIEKYDTICNNSDYVWDGHSNSGRPIYDAETGGMINFGHNKLWNNETPKTMFTLTDSLRTKTCRECPKKGCDSVYVLYLTVLPSYHYEVDIDFSEEDVMECGGVIYGGAKATKPYDVLIDKDQTITCSYTLRTGTHECDSTVVKHIRLGNVWRDTTYVFVGGGEEYTWHRTTAEGADKMVCTLKAEGGKTLYCYDRYETTLGFDSIYILALYGAQDYHFSKTDSVCQADGTYDWSGHMGTENNLRINGLPIKEISIRESGWVTVTDRLVSIVTHKDPHGGVPTTTYADSIYTLNLYVKPVYNDKFNRNIVVSSDTLCSNEQYVWERTLYVGQDYDETANPIDPTSPYYDDIVRINATDLDANGLYTRQIPMTTYLGCDSILYMRLKFNKIGQTHITPRIGDNDATWTFGHGNNLHTGEEYLVDDYTDETRTIREYSYVDTLQTATGCDSIVKCDLTVLPTYLIWDPEDKTCTTDKYDWRTEYTNKFININLVRKDYFYDTLTSVQFGADSIRALHLIHIPGYLEKEEKILCKDKFILWHGDTIKYKPSNEGSLWVDYEQRFKGVDECDSLFQVRVQYFDVYDFGVVEEKQICRYDEFHWYDEDGIEHIKGLRDEKGKKLKTIPTDTVGWITIYDSLKTVTCGCDSVYTLRLYVNDAVRIYDPVTICSDETFIWDKNNRTYAFDTDTIIRDTVIVPNVSGCNDSSFLYLEINKAYHFEEDMEVVCGFELPYTWPGHDDRIDLQPSDVEKWTEDRIFDLWDRNTTVLGCDSNYHRPVRVMPEQKTFIDTTICLGDTLYWRNHVMTQTQVITDEDKNIYGCDSSITMNLVVIPPTQFTIADMPAICADDKSFDIRFASVGEPAIAYCVHYDDRAHAQNFVDVEWTDISPDERTLTLPMPVLEDVMHYTVPGDYSADIYFDNGYCLDSNLLVMPLDFQVRYPSWLMEQHWNDAIGLLVDSLNGGYHFYAFQWYKNDILMPGETKPYLYCPQYLESDALYSVALSRASDSLTYLTCYLSPDLSQQQTLTPSLPYISVVPTHVVVENPVVNILCVNSGTYEIFDPYGAKITSGVYHPGSHNAQEVQLPAVPGVYIFHLHDSSYLERTVKVLVK